MLDFLGFKEKFIILQLIKKYSVRQERQAMRTLWAIPSVISPPSPLWKAFSKGGFEKASRLTFRKADTR